MKKTVRLTALMLAIAVFSVMLLSVAFIIIQADHECLSENCLLCCQLAACQDCLKVLLLAWITIILALAAIRATAAYLPVYASGQSVRSLITLKVKLSD